MNTIPDSFKEALLLQLLRQLNSVAILEKHSCDSV